MIRLLVACAIGLTAAACSSEPTQPLPPSAALWPVEKPTAVAPRPKPKAAPRPARAKVAAKKKTKPPKRAPKRKPTATIPAARQAYWCSRIPAGTTMAQVDAAASGFGKTLTAAQRRQTQACIASK